MTTFMDYTDADRLRHDHPDCWCPGPCRVHDWTPTDTERISGVVFDLLRAVPDEDLPGIVADLEGTLKGMASESPACRRADAEGIAHDIAEMPAMNRHSIGANDEICGPDGPLGYRMQDFIPEAELAAYRTYVYGSPVSTAESPWIGDPPLQLDDCDGSPERCTGGHWGPGGMEWHYGYRPCAVPGDDSVYYAPVALPF